MSGKRCKMAKRKRKIKYKKERVVLADILPYEVPITFSLRHFYNFLVDNKIEVNGKYVIWKKLDDTLDEIIKFIFDFNNIEENGATKRASFNKDNKYYTIPFNYKIAHKEKEFRDLSLIHPANQVIVVDFYDKYKELILYYCSISPFSIRKPHKIAKFTYFNDTKHKQNKAEVPERDIIEIFGKEYENLKTFFAYQKYSNIYKFYESYTYHRSEKKYNKLFKFDISKCFDSIYTHSLSWAILNKEVVKNHKENSFTLGGSFDILMQKLNYNETNGIVIGPEVSRIFAEVLLQQIDFAVYKRLETNIKHKIHYEIFRYVDDYFLFYNEENIKEKILEYFIIELKKFNLHINETKFFSYSKPIITELTIAKERIRNLLNKLIELKSEQIDNETEDDEDETKAKKYSIFFNSKKAIVNFKIIIKETGIEYKDILNYTLDKIDRKVFNILQNYDKAVFENDDKEQKFKTKFVKSIIEILDFTFFLYSVSPRANTTIKISTMLAKLTKFIKEKKDKNDSQKKYFSLDEKNLIFKKIYDDISFVLNKNRNTENTQVESLYLLTSLCDLGREYRLDKETLRRYFNIEIEKNGDYKFPYSFNYWSISVLLFYIRNLVRYDEIRIALKKHILEKYKQGDKNNLRKNAEFIFLTLDILSCPYLDENDDRYKIKILNLCGFNKYERQKKKDIIRKVKDIKYWFTKWQNFDLEKELSTKRSQEVY